MEFCGYGVIMSMVSWELEIPNQDHNISVLRGYLISYWLTLLLEVGIQLH
uniref:Uncharacterized protein n=1 Tax=Setaria italica TaxID=4555 RepID=K3Z174_SETIT